MEPFEARLTPSLLDRLTDYAPTARHETPLNRLQALRALKASVARDLSSLLNARRSEQEIPEQFSETTQSLLMFGLPDLNSYSLKNPSDLSRVRRTIEVAIRRFEPRLEKVLVTFTEPEETAAALHFRVEALLRVDPVPEPVSFETLLQPESGHFVVLGAGR